MVRFVVDERVGRVAARVLEQPLEHVVVDVSTTQGGKKLSTQMKMTRLSFSNFAREEVAQFRSLLERVRGEVKDLDADDIDSGNFGVE